MARIEPLDPAQATGKARELLDAVKAKFGRVPNMMRTLAHAPATLEAYLGFSAALGHTTLSPAVREQIALAIAEQTGCEYCLAAHAAIGKMAGLPAGEIDAARRGESADPRARAALRFARAVVAAHGNVGEADWHAARSAGLSGAELIEVIAAVALNLYTNFVNKALEIAVDFPRVADRPAA